MRTLLLVFSLLLLSVGCDRTAHARLHSAIGLDEGTPVVVSGVEIGQVRRIQLIEGQVDAELSLDAEHELTIREDTCAAAGRLPDGRGALIVSAGRGAPVTGEASIPECELSRAELGEAFQELGEGMGIVLRQVSEGFVEGLTKRAP